MFGLLLVHPHACISLCPAVPNGGLPTLMECLCRCPGRLLHTEPLAACVGSSWFSLSACTNPHGTELRLGGTTACTDLQWEPPLCSTASPSETVPGSCSGLTWIHGDARHQGLHGKSLACICLQGSPRAGLDWDMVFDLRSTQCLRCREGCCIMPFCLAGVESP